MIRTKEPTGKLLGRLAAGAGRILSASVSERAGRWFVSFTCQVERSQVEAPGGRPVGVDVGVKCLAVLSTGEQVPNPKHLQLAYKTGWSGSELVVADRWYPSSKTCSTCGAVKSKLPLAQRTYHC